MPRYAALLRAINVGGHTVKMSELRAAFESMRFRSVETVIASGNVLFDAPSTDALALERRIETKLRKTLGYDVDTFLRTPQELASIVASPIFGPEDPVVEGHTLQVIFLKNPLAPEYRDRLLALRTDYDDFRVIGREAYWRCRGRISDSKLTPKMFDGAFNGPGTARNITTVRKLAAKLNP